MHVYRWRIKRIHCLSHQFLPVKPLEKHMLFQLLVPSSNSVLRTAAQKFLDEGLAALGTVPRIFDA
jgi:hypothetical protein